MREAATLAAVTRRRGPLPAPQARRRVREGRTSALLVLPSSGCRGTAPQATRRNHSHRLRVSTIGLLRASPCSPRRGNRKARLPLRAPLSRPLRSAMGRCPPSRPRPTARDQRQRALPPMVGHSTQAVAYELCELTAPSSKSQATSRHAPVACRFTLEALSCFSSLRGHPTPTVGESKGGPVSPPRPPAPSAASHRQ